jgi:hypothetical protein
MKRLPFSVHLCLLAVKVRFPFGAIVEQLCERLFADVQLRCLQSLASPVRSFFIALLNDDEPIV